MNEKLNLTLPEREEKGVKKSSKGLFILITIVLIAVIANIAVALIQSRYGHINSKGVSLSAESKKRLALKLEKQGLNDVSVIAWKEYINASLPDEKEAAMIWYRIGKLYQNDAHYEKALDSYYRSESFAGMDEIGPEISRHIQECLESMGKYAALRYELAERVGVISSSDNEDNDTRGGQIVAEIGPQKISKAELDRRIEQHIDRQLYQIASYLPEDERRKQKEQLLKQFSSNSKRRMFLNQFILEEILYRKALETKLTDNPEIRGIMKDQERSLLSRMLIEKEFADKIKISPVDLNTYYEAHKKNYISPEKAEIAHILVKNEKEAGKARRQLKNGLDFEEIAKELSRDASTRDNGGRISGWIEKGKKSIPGIGDSDEAMQVIFATEKGHIANKDVKTSKGIHIIKVLERKPERQKAFDDVGNEVFREFRSQKQSDVQQNLLSVLKEYYDVVIHKSAFLQKEESGKESGN